MTNGKGYPPVPGMRHYPYKKGDLIKVRGEWMECIRYEFSTGRGIAHTIDHGVAEFLFSDVTEVK